MVSAAIELVTELGDWFSDIRREAAAEGFRFITRLFDEWLSGINRFNGQGECLMLARVSEGPAGLCGLNRDPYGDDPRLGRIRHLFVRPVWRGHGIGGVLVHEILESARPHFHRVRLRTDNEKAAQFYCRLGFSPCDSEHATHYVDVSAREFGVG
jgi:GNAT superfamily N-acetyltransferase